MVSEMFCSLGCQVGEKCLELPCDDDVAIYLVLGFVRPNRSSNSHARDLEKIVIQSIRVTRDTLAVVSSSYPLPKYKTPANAHILFTTPCPRLYRYTLLSLSPSKLPHPLLSVNNVIREFGLGLFSLALVNFVASTVQHFLVVLLLPLSPLGLFSLGAEVIAEPLFDAYRLSEMRPLCSVSEKY